MKKKRNMRWFWIGILIIIVGAAVVLAPRLLLASARGLNEENESLERVTAFTGDLTTTISGSGQVVAIQEASLSMSTSGIVTDVLVAVGDDVAAGDILVQLDDTAAQHDLQSARLQLEEAEYNLAVVQSDYDQAVADAADSESDAWADYYDAQQELVEAQAKAADPASNDMMTSAIVNLNGAEDSLSEAWDAYHDVMNDDFAEECEDANEEREGSCDLDVARSDAWKNVERAQDTYDIALSQYNLAVEDLNNGVEAAENQLESAEWSLAHAQTDVEGEDGPIQTALRKVEQAQFALERAQNTLAQSEYHLTRLTLVAPFDGEITAVHVAEGELATGVLIEMMSTAEYDVLLEVDELDIGKLDEGQLATIVLEAWPDTPLETEVSSIAMRADSQAGDNSVVAFDVRLVLPETDLPVRVGMTVNATITNSKLTDVVLVPNQAIIADRSTGRFYVNLVEDATVTETEVKIGARDRQYTQIVEGIVAGDELQVGSGTQEPAFSPENAPGGNGGGFLFGGGGE